MGLAAEKKIYFPTKTLSQLWELSIQMNGTDLYAILWLQCID